METDKDILFLISNTIWIIDYFNKIAYGIIMKINQLKTFKRTRN